MDEENTIWGPTRNGRFREVLIVPDREAMAAVDARMESGPGMRSWLMETGNVTAQTIAAQVVGHAAVSRYREKVWYDYSTSVATHLAIMSGAAGFAFQKIYEAEQKTNDPRLFGAPATRARCEAVVSAAAVGGGVLRLELDKVFIGGGFKVYQEWSSLWSEDPSVLHKITFGE